MQKKKIKYNNNNFLALSDTSQLEKIREFVTIRAIDFGFDELNSGQIALAVDEACTNLIKYSYKFDPNKTIKIQIETQNNQFIVNILDNGQPFNPIDVSSPNMENHLKNYKRGGLGIHIIKNIMDEISYSPASDNVSENILKLKKKLI